MILNITLSILNHIYTENDEYFKSSNNKYLNNQSIQKLCINYFILRIDFYPFKFTIFYNYYRCASDRIGRLV
jgi:membrane-bound acyltransferase YfiQ involved in biofilm formation